MLRRLAISLSLLAIWPQSPESTALAQAQATPVAEQVRAIASPRNPLPAESASAAVTRFSFLVYGDTRGRRDGVAEQYEHSLIVDSALATIKRLADGPAPVKFVLQTGDAVVNGRDARQWNMSFVNLINRVDDRGWRSVFPCAGQSRRHRRPRIRRAVARRRASKLSVSDWQPDSARWRAAAPRRVSHICVWIWEYVFHRTRFQHRNR